MSQSTRTTIGLLSVLVVTVGSAAAQSVSWTATFDGGLTLGSSSPVTPQGIAVDAQGNTYVAGQGTTGFAPEPLAGGRAMWGLLVKYGAQGQPLWTRQIEDGILALILDEQQQPLVLTVYATLKYGTSGNLLWRAPHLVNGRWVLAKAAAPAPGGGLYLAGSTQDTAKPHTDLAVARLDGSGRPVWLGTWGGATGLDDEAQSIGVDAAGRVYVAGRSRKQDGPDVDAHVTAAFDGTGGLLWAATLAAPDYSKRAAFAVDPAGGVFLSVPLGPGASDWRSVRYGASGAVSWSRDFSDLVDLEYGAPDLAAVAPDGAVYVLGHTTPSRFPELVRYSASGTQQWAIVGSPTVLEWDESAAGLAADAAGRAVVVRSLYSGELRTSAYDASGATAWSKDLAWSYGNPPAPARVGAAGLAVGPSGEVRIAATRQAGVNGVLLAVGYDAAGSFQWGVELPPLPPDEGAVGVELDGSGNAFVLATGVADGQPLFRTLKHDAAGALLWARAFPGRPSSLAVTSTGEAFAAGRSETVVGGEFAIVKYDAAGAEVWSRTYRPPQFSSIEATHVAVAVDAAGSVYLAGRAVGSDFRMAVVKYSPDGLFQWSRSGAYPIADLTPVGPCLSLSPAGNVIVGGSAYEPPTGRLSQFHVWALDPNGNTLWNALGDSTGVIGSNTGALAVDALGNVVVGDFYSGEVVKLSPSGARLWSVASGDRIIALAVDPSGAIAVASREPTPLGFGFRYARYGASGDLQWSHFVDAQPIALWSWALRTTADGRVYAAGQYTDQSLDYQRGAFVAAFDGAGQVRWARAATGSGPAAFTDLDRDGAGRLVAAGYVAKGSTNFDVLVQSMTDDPAQPLAFHTVSPCRVFDSRDPSLGGPAAVPANAPFEAQVAGRCGVPATARSVALNVTVTGATAAGHVTLFPAGRVPPPTSTINHPVGTTRASQAVVGVGDGGRVVVRAIQGSGSTHVILDVSGYFE